MATNIKPSYNIGQKLMEKETGLPFTIKNIKIVKDMSEGLHGTDVVLYFVGAYYQPFKLRDLHEKFYFVEE